MRRRSVRLAAVVTLGALLAFLAVYAISRGTGPGSRFDQTAVLYGLDDGNFARVHEASDRFVRTVDRGALAVAGVLVVAAAALRGRWRLGLLALVLVGSVNVTTQVLKVVLGGLDVFGTDAGRIAPAAFPSGHSTVAMSIACALVLMAPASLRPVAALAGGAYAAAMGASLLAIGTHYPSDVVGAFVLTAAFAAAAAGAVRRFDLDSAVVPRRPVRRGLIAALWLAAAGAAALGVLAVAAVLRRPEIVEAGVVHARFVAAAVLSGVAGLVLPAALVAQLAAHQRVTSARSAASATGTATPVSGTAATAPRSP